MVLEEVFADGVALLRHWNFVSSVDPLLFSFPLLDLVPKYLTFAFERNQSWVIQLLNLILLLLKQDSLLLFTISIPNCLGCEQDELLVA